MAGLPIEFHTEATEEYLSAVAWYRDQSPKAAENFAKAFDQAIEHIRQSPGRWPIYFKGCRRYTLRQFPFTIVYRSGPSLTRVVAVAHGSRRPRYWRNRL